MAQALLHGGPAGNLLVNVSGTPETIQYQAMPIVASHSIQTHPAPQETNKITSVPVVLYHKVRKIVPDALLHYLYEPEYLKLVTNRGF